MVLEGSCFRAGRVLALLVLWGLLSTGPGLPAAPDVDAQLRALREGGLRERREVLNWLQHHGDATAVEPLLGHLRDADPDARNLAEEALWAIWSRSGDAETDQLLTAGGRLLAVGRYLAALGFFDQVVARRPDFAEGHNKRATALYYLGRYALSLEAIRETLRRNPVHFGALSGAGFCKMQQELPQEALLFFERALEINPNLETIRSLAEQLRRLARRNRVSAPQPRRRPGGRRAL